MHRDWARIEPWAAAAALGWCALRLARGLGPAPFYNSDCAVPVLLMQGMGDGAFTLYYPHQDRFGMWPFLLGRALHLATPEAFHVLLVLALCSAAIPLSAVLGSPALAVLTLVLPFVLRHSVFQSCQPYLWQVVALLWAWWAIRSALAGRTRRTRLLALGGLTVSTALAAWMNTYSLVAVLGLVAVEAVHARLRGSRLAGPVLALGLAGLFEAMLRNRYNVYCQRTFGETFITPLRLDHGRLLANVERVVIVLRKEGGQVPLLIGAALAIIPGRSRTECVNQLGLVWLAVCALPALAAVRYFRENGFAGRYFSFPTFWTLAAALYGALLLLSVLAGQRSGAVRGLALVGLVLAVPAGPTGFLDAPRAEAQTLAASRATVLLADYWEVYVPASLAPPGVLLPVSAEGNLNRYPATQAELRPGASVLASCALDRPDGTLEQYGALLRRTADPPVPGTRGPWCLHAVERAARPVRRER